MKFTETEEKFIQRTLTPLPRQYLVEYPEYYPTEGLGLVGTSSLKLNGKRLVLDTSLDIPFIKVWVLASQVGSLYSGGSGGVKYQYRRNFTFGVELKNWETSPCKVEASFQIARWCGLGNSSQKDYLQNFTDNRASITINLNEASNPNSVVSFDGYAFDGKTTVKNNLSTGANSTSNVWKDIEARQVILTSLKVDGATKLSNKQFTMLSPYRFEIDYNYHVGN